MVRRKRRDDAFERRCRRWEQDSLKLRNELAIKWQAGARQVLVCHSHMAATVHAYAVYSP
jgi:hypothetical protein